MLATRARPAGLNTVPRKGVKIKLLSHERKYQALTVGFCILAGGKASRMNGVDKSAIIVNGETILSHLIREFGFFEEKILAAGERDIALPEGFISVPDRENGIGPLGGLAAALEIAKSDALFVCACDMPGLRRENYDLLCEKLKGRDAVVASASCGVQPLCGIYSKSCLSAIGECIKNQEYSLRLLLDKVDTAYVEQTERRDFRNINTPKDCR